MLKLNKYLREIGINENSWLFKDIKENTLKKLNGEEYDNRYIEDEDGFINAETFALDNTLAIIIYSYLCYFRDNCTGFSVPGAIADGVANIEDATEKWIGILNDMIEGFRMYIKIDIESPSLTDYDINNGGYEIWKKDMADYYQKINNSLQLFAKYFSQLSW